MEEQMSLRSDGSERVPYYSDSFPMHASVCRLSAYPGMTCIDHWHHDWEYILVLSGRMRYMVNGQGCLLAAGHGLIVTPRQIHGATALDGEEAVFLCVVFPASLPGQREDMSAAVSSRLEAAQNIPFLLLDPGQLSAQPVIAQLEQLHRCLAESQNELPLPMLGCACWLLWHTGTLLCAAPQAAQRERHLSQLRQMLGFIQSHYAERISLAQIANAGALSKSACTQVFQRVLHLSPMSYVNDYRLERAMELLNRTAQSMMEIALSCGFCSASYFAELFMRRTGSTPTHYRKALPPLGTAQGEQLPPVCR